MQQTAGTTQSLSMQEVIDNLMISAIQYRSETDPDIQPHVHQRCVVERVVQPTREVDYCKQTLIHVLQDVLTSLARMQVAVLGNCFKFGLACMVQTGTIAGC